jgi:hypothetical protein
MGADGGGGVQRLLAEPIGQLGIPGLRASFFALECEIVNSFQTELRGAAVRRRGLSRDPGSAGGRARAVEEIGLISVVALAAQFDILA